MSIDPRLKKILLFTSLGAILVLSAPFVYLFGFIGFDSIREVIGREDFDSTLWKDINIVYEEPFPRIKMIDNLLATFSFKGQSRKNVVGLLGEPKPTNYFSNYQLVYWLGPERHFYSIDSEWLVFSINEQGVVVSSSVVSD